jgi:YHS domain-containing protein
MAIDPVCAMKVGESTAPATTVYNGVTYYFCSQKCLHDFQAQPDGFVRTLALIEPPETRADPPATVPRRWWNTLCAGWCSLAGKVTRAGPR